MSRKPLAALAASATVLALAGIALAHDKGPTSTQPVTATFSAATVSDVVTSTCTGADGTYTQTKATYSGDSTSADPRLAGKLTIRARSVYNTTTNVGHVEGMFRIESASGHAGGVLAAVDTGGALAGFMAGRVKDPWGKLFANFSATFDPATGFSAGQLGSGSSPDTAIVASGSCSGEHGDQGGNGEHQQGKDKKHGKHDHKGSKK